MGFQLTITRGKGHGKNFFFDKPVVRIGRLPDNDLVLYDTGVSRYHCEILDDDGRHTLRDTSSANGTLLNDVVTTEGRIGDGDRIGVGPITFVFSPREKVRKGKRRVGAQSVSRPDDDAVRRELEEDQTRALTREDFDPDAIRERMQSRDGVSVERTATGSFVAHRRRMTQRFRKLPRSTRFAVIAAIALVVAGLVASAYIINSRPKDDRSSEIFPLTANSAALIFGANDTSSVHTPDRVNFRFHYEGGQATVSYTAFNIESERELEVLVNGKSIGFSERAARLTRNLTLELPRELLLPGQNVLSFDNTATPKREESWGLTQVAVTEEKLPPPDPAKAKELFRLGQAAYDTRTVAPKNLYRAIQYYDDARLRLVAIKKAPPLMAKVLTALKSAENELRNIHNNHMFTSQKAERFGDRAQAVDVMRRLLQYYPDAEDRRHKEVVSRLGKLTGVQR